MLWVALQSSWALSSSLSCTLCVCKLCVTNTHTHSFVISLSVIKLLRGRASVANRLISPNEPLLFWATPKQSYVCVCLCMEEVGVGPWTRSHHHLTHHHLTHLTEHWWSRSLEHHTTTGTHLILQVYTYSATTRNLHTNSNKRDLSQQFMHTVIQCLTYFSE